MWLLLSGPLCVKIVAMNTEFEKKYIEARRAVIAGDFARLRPESAAALRCSAPPAAAWG